MALVDEQHSLWSNFYVGNYKAALQEATEKNGFAVRSDFSDKTSIQSPEKLDKLAAVLTKLSSDPSQDPHVIGVQSAATAVREGPRQAVELSRTATSPELIAQRVQYFLMWNRVDLAQQQLEELRQLIRDEDNALVQRSSCMVRMAIGDSAEARDICSDLIDKFSSTGVLLVSRAAAQMQGGEWESALNDLKQAETMQASPSDVKVNILCCSARLKQDDFPNLFQEFKKQFPEHSLVSKLKEGSLAFGQFSP